MPAIELPDVDRRLGARWLAWRSPPGRGARRWCEQTPPPAGGQILPDLPRAVCGNWGRSVLAAGPLPV